MKENKFWLDSISSFYFHKIDPERILDYDQLVDTLSVEIIQLAARNYINTENYVKVVLYPEVID